MPARPPTLLLIALGAALAACAGAHTQDTSHAMHDHEAHPQHEQHAEHAQHEQHEQHGHAGHQEHRFEDPEAYAESWNDPARDAWQQPDAIIDAMSLEPRMTVAEIGAGTGYFLPFLSAAVGDAGQVLAVDIEPNMLAFIEATVAEKGLGNVATRLASAGDSGLDAASVDRILIVNVWHHIPDRAAYAQHLRSRLRTGGSVWIVDFTADSPSGPPPEYRLAPELVAEELRAGGFEAELHSLVLERQYVVVGRY